jgi:hypothetical protein
MSDMQSTPLKSVLRDQVAAQQARHLHAVRLSEYRDAKHVVSDLLHQPAIDRKVFDRAVEVFDEVSFAEYRPSSFADAEDRARCHHDAQVEGLEAFLRSYLAEVKRS